VVADVHAECECTVVRSGAFRGARVTPGTTLTLDGHVDVGYRGGTVRKGVAVTLADGRTIAAELKWTVKRAYTASPDKLAFFVLEDEGPESTFVDFDSQTAKPVGPPRVDSPWLSATRTGGRIRIAVDPQTAPSGKTWGHVLLRTDDPHVPLLSIPVLADKLAKINVYPNRVWLPAGATRIVRITDAAGAFPRISATSNSSAVEIVELSFGSLTLRAAKSGPFPARTLVTITTDDGDRYDLPVEVLPSREER